MRSFVLFSLMTVFVALGAEPARGHDEGKNGPALTAPSVTVVDLGSLGGNNSSAHAINESGQVVGFSENSDRQKHAFVWAPGGTMRDLGTLGGTESVAWDINDVGQIAGWSNNVFGQQRPVVWMADGRSIDLGSFGGEFGIALGINASGQVAGWSHNAAGEARAFVWTPGGSMVSLGTLGGRHSFAHAINDRGEVVGKSETASGEVHAFLWTPASGMIDLGTLGGGTSEAWGLNSEQWAVGQTSALTGQQLAFPAVLWSGSQSQVPLTGLGGSHSLALDVNELAEIAGWSFTSSGATRASVWDPSGAILDLGQLLGTDFSVAYGLNGVGQVVGAGWDSQFRLRALIWSFDRNSPPPPPDVVNPDERIADLIAQIESLEEMGAVKKGVARSLIAKLEAARKLLAKERPGQAARLLAVFSKNVNTFVASALLADAMGQQLTTEASAILP